MGDQENFVRAFLTALSNEDIIAKFRTIISDPLDIQLQQVKKTNEQLTTQISSLKEENKNIRDDLAVWKTKFDEKERAIQALQNRVADLEKQNEQNEQNSRKNNIRVKGLPEKNNEDLVARFKFLARHRMNTELDDMDIDNIHRLGPVRNDGSTRDVIVKFTTYRARHIIYKARSGLRKAGSYEEIDPEVVTPDVAAEREEIKGLMPDLTLRGIFINDDLTKHRARLLWMARNLKKQNKLNDCWSFDGRVVVKDKNNKITTIQSEDDLHVFH
jgi:exosome complex exonuclease DIS3/RRP44